ncbi:MAG: serine hydrolase [Pseudomonadota bacterium]
MNTKTKQRITMIFVIGALLAGCALSDKVQRLRYATSLFSGQEQYENFARIPSMFPVSTLTPAENAYRWPTRPPMALPETFLHQGEDTNLEQFISETDTAALLVIHDGAIRYERYWLTGGQTVAWPSWSVAKSFVSALVGIAVRDGLIDDVDDPVTRYLPELDGSGYDGVSIKDILQMSSGARWNEDYSDFGSDINRLGRILALGGSLDRFIAKIEPELPPGSFNRYNSADTQVLGRLLVKVSGQSLSDYMQTALWTPLGAESNGHWLLDNRNMEMAFAGFHATARDYAKLGELYRVAGQWRGEQLIPAQWIDDSITPDAPHLQPGENRASNNVFGYGYQWWLLDPSKDEFTAMGVYNQFIYVNRRANTVIVKLSANSDFGVTDDQSSYRDQETISMFRAIAASAQNL